MFLSDDSEEIDTDRVLHLAFEADDLFLAEMKVMREEFAEFQRRQHEEYNAAVERFRQRIFSKRDAAN